MAPIELLGRDAELAAVDLFLEESALAPGALVFEGEPGIGKTTLWHEAVRRAERLELRVLWCRPVEAEASLSFSALADLLEAAPDDAFESLSAPQRRALDVALLRSDPEGTSPDSRAVAAAFRSVLAWTASESPTLVAIDDVQWLDPASANTFGFALRREPIMVIATRRSGVTIEPVLAGALSEARQILVGPLSLGATHELLKQRLGRSLPRPLLVRVHDAARGNPFYALEVAREVLEAGVSAGDPLPVPGDLRRLLTRRMKRLSPAAQQLLLGAATAGQPTRSLLARVLDEDPSPALEEAELAGMLELQKGQLRFAHPLYAAAVYAAAPRERRRRLHKRLAEAVEDEEERARHRALATDSPSEEVAAVLEQAAVHARARGAWAAAAAFFADASRLTPAADQKTAHRRALAGAEILFDSADTAGSRSIVERLVREMPSGPDRARALLLLAVVHYYEDGPGPAKEVLSAGARGRRRRRRPGSGDSSAVRLRLRGRSGACPAECPPGEGARRRRSRRPRRPGCRRPARGG
jgi:predicted ATPase